MTNEYENLSFEILDEKWATDLQNGLEEYLDTLRETHYQTVENNGFDVEIETESGISYCGCSVCEYREILSYTTPRIIKGYLESKVLLVEGHNVNGLNTSPKDSK